MINLTTTSEILRLVTGSAVSTDYSVEYEDSTPAGTLGSLSGNVSTATTTTICAAPGASIQRRIKCIRIRNRHASSSQTVTLRKFDGTTETHITAALTVAASEVLVIDANGNLSLLDSNGLPKVSASFSGDITASGGFLHSVGPFYVTTAASQTDAALKLGDTAGQSWVAPRAGSVMASSAMVDAAVTGAGTSVTVKVFKNGSLLNAAFNLAFTQAGAETGAYATAAKDLYTFAAGDKITVTYTSTAISNTPKAVAFVHVEY